eukprot:COSAG01_NODE_5643_length_4121_cov_2.779960_6_plen_75_part_00
MTMISTLRYEPSSRWKRKLVCNTSTFTFGYHHTISTPGENIAKTAHTTASQASALSASKKFASKLVSTVILRRT